MIGGGLGAGERAFKVARPKALEESTAQDNGARRVWPYSSYVVQAFVY